MKYLEDDFDWYDAENQPSPKISLIMPIYNAEDTLQRALDSIPLAKDTQVILIDDGSTDKSWAIALDWYAKHYEDLHRRSVIHRWTDNRGVAKAMNLGFSLADGEYIVSLSSDDYYVVDFDQFRPFLDGKNDLIYFDLEVNDGSVWHLDIIILYLWVSNEKMHRKEAPDRMPLQEDRSHHLPPYRYAFGA